MVCSSSDSVTTASWMSRLSDAGDLVVGEQVGRIGHGHAEEGAGVFQHDGAEAARLRLRQPHGDFGLDREMLEIDVGNLQLPGQRGRDLLLGDETLLDEHAAELAPAALLFVERVLELLLGEQVLLQ